MQALVQKGDERERERGVLTVTAWLDLLESGSALLRRLRERLHVKVPSVQGRRLCQPLRGQIHEVDRTARQPLRRAERTDDAVGGRLTWEFRLMAPGITWDVDDGR